MKLLILGASGGVGEELVKQSVAAGHEVTAVMRTKRDVPDGVRLVLDDVQRDGAIESVMEGQDVVLSALGIRRVNQSNPMSPLASPVDFTSRTAEAIVRAMKAKGVKRVVAVSAAGVGDSNAGLNWMMRMMIRWTNVGANYRDLEAMERVYSQSDLDWCCVRPTGLKSGPATGKWKEIHSFPFNAWISRADVAKWMVEHLDRNGATGRTPIITEVRG